MHVLGSIFIDKNAITFLKAILLCLFFCINTNQSSAQAPGILEFEGKTIKDGKILSGATVTVFRNGTIEQEKIKTGRNGKFSFSLVFGVDYKMTFSYPGCLDMHLLVMTSKLPKSKNNIFPLYLTEVPFFEITNTTVRISKYKNPFTTVVYDGKKGFKDDEVYLALFTKDLLINPEEQNKIFAEKVEKEKGEREAIEMARLEEERKAAYEDRLRAEEREKAAMLARMKDESAKQKVVFDETMETEAIRLQREKEAKNVMAKKNKEIKTNYETNLLKMVAENERIEKQKAYTKQKIEARTNTVIQQMKREADVKGKADKLRAEQKQKKKELLANQQQKNNELNKLVEAAAFANRSVRINNQKILPSIAGYKLKELPNFSVSIEEGILYTMRTTTIRQGKQLDTFTKKIYFWGTIDCYKNNMSINETQYNSEIELFSAYQNYL